jgi:hypothetical protein
MMIKSSSYSSIEHPLSVHDFHDIRAFAITRIQNDSTEYILTNSGVDGIITDAIHPIAETLFTDCDT